MAQSTFAESYLVNLGTSWSGSALGHLAIACFDSAYTAKVVAVTAVLVCFVFSPSLNQLSNMPAFSRALSSLSYHRYATEAGHLLELRHWAGMYDLTSTFESLDYDVNHLPFCIWAMLLFGFVLRIVATLTFARRLSNRAA
uniref:ABC-2 type transporter transmembrane domain-containing protein n=1 Tax=Haptolina brevifila TaxID=156173 RepID=A0A7S2JHJ8_9EUKA|mmetsp:Transcript_82656/g.164949  ORF Transcript_82656/g.164949 Transcript_82656/m.164949 type:complete len:141 (+) Transcript_82656:3-425(+)